MSENIVSLSNVRISFPHLAAPSAFKEGDTPKFSAIFLLPPDHPGVVAFQKAIAFVAQEKWKEKASGAMEVLKSDRKIRPFSRGEEHVDAKSLAVRPGYEGMFVISARNQSRPQIYKADGHKVDPENTMEIRAAAEKIYGGCYVNAVVKPYAYKEGIGMACELLGVQFFKDGDAFGTPVADISGMFAPVASVAPSAPFKL